MKYMRVSVLLTVLVATLMAGCARAATSQPDPAEGPKALWEEVLRVKVEQPTRIAAFLDETLGLTCGSGETGKAHYTTDGGQTWTMADTSGG